MKKALKVIKMEIFAAGICLDEWVNSGFKLVLSDINICYWIFWQKNESQKKSFLIVSNFSEVLVGIL